MTTKRTRTPAGRAKDRERCAAYYSEHRDAILQRRRARYAHDAEYRAAVNRANRERYATRKHALSENEAYRRGYADGMKAARAGNFADFSAPIPPERAARLMDPTLED